MLSQENKELLVNRAKSFAWRLGGMVAVAVLGFFLENLELLNLPDGVIVVIGLIAGEVTKFIKVKAQLAGLKK